MKHKFLFLAVLLSTLFTASLWAQTPAGYAIYGAVPYGYTDLRDNIEVSIPAVVSGQDIQGSSVYSAPADQNGLAFTGNGLSGGNACQNFAALSIRLKSDQTLTLTEGMVIHLKIKRSDENTSGLMRISMHKNTWGNGGRLTFEISNTDLTSSVSELLCAYNSPLNWNWSTDGKANLIGTQTYYGGAGKEFFRFEAASGEAFEITQIYIDADATDADPVAPVAGDTDAPTGLTLAASNIQDQSVTLTASATDENSPISYQFYFKAEGDADFTAVSGAVAAASGADAVKVVTGLTPEATYSFKVVASDPSSNSSDYSISGITTLALVERRYYFFRGDPASVTLPSTGVISYDLRRGVKTNVAPQGGMTLTENKYFSHFARSGSWWSFNQSLSASFDMSEISQADWYLVVKFRTDYTSNSFNIRLNNGISYQVSQNNLSISADGTWNVLTLALADAKNALTYSAFSTNQMLFQFHADEGAGSYLDIAYAYLTNNAASVDDFADNVAPVISSLSDGDKTTSSVVLTVNASDDSGEDITYIVKENDAVLTSAPATGTSGAATAITVSELVGQNHTLTVIARDGAGNEVSQNIAVTLPAAVAPPSNLVVTTTNTYKSVTFTMSADDDNASLVYAILDGLDNVLVDNIAGTAGVETVYTLHDLTPETAYSFKVRVTNAASLSTTSAAINITTDALSEHRFYLVRGDNSEPLPSSASLTSTLVNCNVEFGNSARDARISDYVSLVTGNSWMAVTFKPTAAVANTINDEWYIVVRMRNSLTNSFDFNRFRLNLSNGAANWYINNSDDDKPFGHDYNDNGWVTFTKKIGDRRAGTAVPASYLAAGEVAAQVHVDKDLIAGDYFDIDYIYFTDDITSLDPGTQTGKKIVIKEGADNASVLAANDGQTVDVYLRRTLSSASFNTFCVPFDMSADEVEETFGAGVVIGKLGNARIKENDELYLGFEFVDALEAGVPYIIQPLANVANPLLFAKTIDKDAHPKVIDGVISFNGVFSPYAIPQQSAESHTILLLGAENKLSWPNAAENMKGMRAYFDLSTQAASVVRRARFGFQQEGQATGIDQISNDQSQITNKVVIDGQLIIIRDGVRYNVMGTKLQ